MSYRIHAEADSAAPPEVIFDLVAHAETWPSWSKASVGELDRPAADGDPNGVGAIRRFVTGRTTSIEEIVAFDRPHRSSYTLLSGLPLRDYRADVVMSPRPDGGTHITWDSQFRSARWGTGFLYRAALQRFIAQTAKLLAEAGDLATMGESG